ncbi:parallel beta-helix domain-containing protein [Aliikangiella sp. G2MR2-5]|uniref:parallel beta-helix domain-containing protein n=1 Tax=Aliikangiella sp. G2MR2-5 TaxID=2788943 RepID=UPI001FEF5B7D|nr:parallel beta-helix domain-containing protein [Aliikangiella sp. G2MR2-5]
MSSPRKWTGYIFAAITLVIGYFIGQMNIDNSGIIVGDTDRYQQNSPSEKKTFGQVSEIERPPFIGQIHEVRDGESIQAAVDNSNPGDKILVYPGTYKETVYIDKDDITLSGVIVEGDWPVLEGEGKLNDAVLYSGNNFTVENFLITHYKGNGVMGQAGNNFIIRNNMIIDTGVYGIFPEFGKNGIIEYNVLTGIEDAAIYVGMCDNIHVAHNEVFANVAGIEIENSRHAIVENNFAHNNTGGILVFITPGLPIKTTYDVIVRDNFVVDNNHENFGAPGSIVAGIPPGTGILIMAGDEVTLENNVITGNNNAGIIITDHGHAANLTLDPGAEPNSDKIAILDNVMYNNGNEPIDEVKALMMTKFSKRGPDIIRVGESKESCILNREKYLTFGIDEFGTCAFDTTYGTKTYLLEKPVAPREITVKERGKLAYYGICAGCHAYNVKMIGPPTQVIQALYMDNPQGIAEYISNPIKKRDDYPEMPPQDYLSDEVKLAAAKFMLEFNPGNSE